MTMENKANALIPTIIILMIIIAFAIVFLIFTMPNAKTETTQTSYFVSGQTQQKTLSDGLILYLPFDEVQGQTTPDESGNLNNGIIGNQVVLTDDSAVGSGALKFKGEFREYGGGVTVPTSPSLELSNDMTISVWIKSQNWEDIGNWAFNEVPDSPHVVDYFKISNLIDRRNHWSSMDWELIYHEIPWNGQSNLYVWFANSEREKYIYNAEEFKATQDTVFAQSTNKLAENQWYHIVVVREGDIWMLYLNGVRIATEKSETGVGSTEDIHIGNHFDGIVDDVRIYDRALNQFEVQDLYSLGNK